jgi:hypothetical protein
MQWYKVEDKMPERFVSVLGYVPDQTPLPHRKRVLVCGRFGLVFSGADGDVSNNALGRNARI